MLVGVSDILLTIEASETILPEDVCHFPGERLGMTAALWPRELPRKLRMWRLTKIDQQMVSFGGASTVSTVMVQTFCGNFRHPVFVCCLVLGETGCFERANSLSSAPNLLSSARNSVSSLWYTNKRLRGNQ